MGGLLIIGAGGHGKVIADIASAMGQWEKIAFVDDKFPEMMTVLDWPILGRISEFAKFRHNYAALFVAVGDNALRKEITKHVEQEKFELPVLVHPRAAVSRFAHLGPGTVVINQAAVNASASIGKGSIVNTGATVGHDCVLGNFVHIAPGASLAGESVIEDCSWVGMGSAVIEKVKVGSFVVVGAGSVILHDVPDYSLIVGVPGRIVRKIAKAELPTLSTCRDDGWSSDQAFEID